MKKRMAAIVMGMVMVIALAGGCTNNNSKPAATNCADNIVHANKGTGNDGAGRDKIAGHNGCADQGAGSDRYTVYRGIADSEIRQ
jgi:hypothetical protein